MVNASVEVTKTDKKQEKPSDSLLRNLQNQQFGKCLYSKKEIRNYNS